MILLLAGCGAGGGGQSGKSSGPSRGASEGSGGAPAKLGTPAIGAADAPVVLTEYSDYQWPYCGKFAREVSPKLIEKYVEDGTLRIEWKDFPYQGQESVDAALAARTAQAQGKFWEYHDLVYANQSSGNSGGYSQENLVALADEAGLDVARFEKDFASARYDAAVQESFREGQNLGISGTPTFVVNGRRIVGLQPIGVFEEVIEDARREAEGG